MQQGWQRGYYSGTTQMQLAFDLSFSISISFPKVRASSKSFRETDERSMGPIRTYPSILETADA